VFNSITPPNSVFRDTIGDLLTKQSDGPVMLAGRYKIVRKLGEGGMGSVWLAEDQKLDGRKVAIKMLPVVLATNARAIQQLKAEAKMAMPLVHSHIVALRSFEDSDEGAFLVMDYVPGKTLEQILAEKGTLTEEEVLKMFRPIAEALDHAHKQKVIHRDIKPSNILIREDGEPFIMDFGIAREMKDTMTRVTGKNSSGTLPYMSPEQLRGEDPTSAQDIYSLAATIYECLSGHPPFHRGQIEYQIANETPKPLTSHSPLARAVMTGLAKQANDRPTTSMHILDHERQVPFSRAHARGKQSVGNWVAAFVLLSLIVVMVIVGQGKWPAFRMPTIHAAKINASGPGNSMVGSTVDPETSQTIRLADIGNSMVGSKITVVGKVLDLMPPPMDSKRPYRLKIADDSGEQVIDFWRAEYDQIQGKDVLIGAYVRAHISVASYENKLQLKLCSGNDLEILNGRSTAAAPMPLEQEAAEAFRQEGAPAPRDFSRGRAPAPRDFSRGRSVQVSSFSVGEVTSDLNGQTIRVHGRVESVTAPKEGTKQPFAVVLKDGDASLRATYWSNVNETIAVKPTPGALFEMEGVVEIYKDLPQLKVGSGYTVKLVDDAPASSPAVDISQAVAVSSISLADMGQARVVKGTLGAPRALRGGVVYPLTDDTGSIDLVLWESSIPVEVLNALGEGAKVAAIGEVGAFGDNMQIIAAPGCSVMKIP